MGTNRTKRRMNQRPMRRQAGITVIGFLLLAAVFGVVGLATLKVVPLYMEQFKIRKVLSDVQTEMANGGNTVNGILSALEARFYIDYLELPREEIQVRREGEGYLVSVTRQSSASFFGDLHFVLDINEQVEIVR